MAIYWVPSRSSWWYVIQNCTVQGLFLGPWIKCGDGLILYGGIHGVSVVPECLGGRKGPGLVYSSEYNGRDRVFKSIGIIIRNSKFTPERVAILE